MLVYYGILIALVALCVGLWVRRSTWSYKWEQAATVNLVGTLIGIVCMTPVATQVSTILHFVTGVWNLEDLLGHIAALAGITVLAYVTINRLELPDAARWRHWRLELPATVMLPIMVGLFILGSPDRPVRDLYMARADFWMTCYWLVLALSLLWVLGHLLWALAIIARWDESSSTVAKIYIFAVTMTCGSVMAKVASLWLTGIGLKTAGWVLICVATVGYVVAAIWGIRSVRRWFTSSERAHQQPAPPGEPTAPGAAA
jgi:hypothetical protein